MREEMIEKYHAIRELAEKTGDDKLLAQASRIKQQWKLTKGETYRPLKFEAASAVRSHVSFDERLRRFHAEEGTWQRESEKLDRKAADAKIVELEEEMELRRGQAQQLVQLGQALIADAGLYLRYVESLRASINALRP